MRSMRSGMVPQPMVPAPKPLSFASGFLDPGADATEKGVSDAPQRELVSALRQSLNLLWDATLRVVSGAQQLATERVRAHGTF